MVKFLKDFNISTGSQRDFLVILLAIYFIKIDC